MDVRGEASRRTGGGAGRHELAHRHEIKYAQRGKTVKIIGLNRPSAHIHGRLGGELTVGH
ncbi:hypothetical protein [Actinoallomurus iriomotensis]|uniref:Uncharacterized protein n=1 Tax=Actinoallomurus iriomotensis TaxID=478107 RepID=A0A9W6RWH7_9ACTN|nr:hypothetical protein [Actinoallomurus iriomotensis]GLY82968.1 hypothetical protein Airi02_008980 [Actinoallomurus iriomotensis]